MKTKEILETLATLFTGFNFHPLFLKELRSLLKKELCGKESVFFKILTTQLKNIKDFGIMVHTTDNNEKLKGMDGHYFSIHLQQSQFNVRLLVYIDGNGIPWFLYAFYERDGKKKTDYSTYTALLKQRIKDMIGDDFNE